MQVQWVSFSKSIFSPPTHVDQRSLLLVSGADPRQHVEQSDNGVGHASHQRSHWTSQPR